MAGEDALRPGTLAGPLAGPLADTAAGEPVAAGDRGDGPPDLARRIPITNDLDIVAARVEGRNLAREMGFGIIDQARIATAISELARNVVLYAHSGEIVLSRVGVDEDRQVEEDVRHPEGSPQAGPGLEIVCRDYGPGIPNVEEILNQHPAADGDAGRETRSSLGMGLSGTRRLMDEFQITSTVGVGTTVVARRWLR